MACVARAIATTLVVALSAPMVFARQARPPLPPQVVSDSFGNSGWKPSDAQARALVERANAYFAARDTAHFAEAYAFFSPAQQRTVPFNGWKAQREAFRAGAGAPRGRTITRVTWYNNPPHAPPGIYAATDFSSRFSRLDVHCGFVAWHLRPDGTYEIAREEEHHASRDTVAKMTPDARQRMRDAFRC